MDEEAKLTATIKMVFELFKHLTTLCTGTILILFAVLERVAEPSWPCLFYFAIGALLISLGSSLYSMFHFAIFFLITGDQPPAEWDMAQERWALLKKSGGWSIVAAMFGYFIGVAALGAFAMANV